MKKAAEIKVIKHLAAKLQTSMKKMPPQFRPDDIHDFRVNYKKMRAALRLMEIKKGGQAKMSKQLKSIYRKTGEVRDLQLLIQKLNTYCEEHALTLTQYLANIQEQLKQLILRLPAAMPRTAGKIPAGIKAGVVKYIPFVNRFCFLSYHILIVQYYNEKRYLAGARLHQVRKNLKDIYYNRLLLGIANAEPPELIVLMEQLGLYQDYCRALGLLCRYAYSDVPQQEQEVLDALKEVWLKERTGLKRALRQQLYRTSLPAMFPWLTDRLQLAPHTRPVIV